MDLEQAKFPELVFGLAGAVGIDTLQIADVLAEALNAVGYKSTNIKLTTEMYRWNGDSPPSPATDYFVGVNSKITYANQQRADRCDPSIMARMAIRAIRRERSLISGAEESVPEKRAYVITQLKRPEEVDTLRKVYGRQFILISAYSSEADRKVALSKKIKGTKQSLQEDHEISALADRLIARDAEESSAYGQRLRDTFHLADVFVNGAQRNEMETHIERFIQAFFGRTDITPSKPEYGMYAAKSASLRSADLSRQVGAAIFTDDGELITQGCNEVPKAFGGTYWDLELPDHRDVKIGQDPNENLKNEILKDLFDRLKQAGLLSKKATALGTAADIAKSLTAKSKLVDGKEVVGGPLSDAMVMDLTEYGRVVHAEMCALCDAARNGKSVKGATLYCTTFPCHNCTKHVLAAGIRRVVYMEPYPKSKAKELHENEIEIEKESDSRVSYIPFLGISPYRYRDIFQKGKRKDGGTARRWLEGTPRPMVQVIAPTHLDLEAMALAAILGAMTPEDAH